MTTYDKYCPGENCKKRDECAMHQFSNICTNFPSLSDWSKEWFGEYNCGDNGNYQYFIPKETSNITDKQIVEDFLHFLDNKNGIINTDNYTYSYQELRNALINYHKETAAADDFHDEVGEMIEWHKAHKEEIHSYQIIEGEGILN